MHAAGRVGENNATGGPNSSAETELSLSVGPVYGNKIKQNKNETKKPFENYLLIVVNNSYIATLGPNGPTQLSPSQPQLRRWGH